MVKAKLHIICGNCGCDNDFKYRIITDFDDELNKEYQKVAIICNNCSTIHLLEDNANKINDDNTHHYTKEDIYKNIVGFIRLYNTEDFPDLTEEEVLKEVKYLWVI